MTATTEKQFDCIALKRRAQDRISEETADMTHAEYVAWLRRSIATGPLADWWSALPGRSSTHDRHASPAANRNGD